jgi:hypothetical protein
VLKRDYIVMNNNDTIPVSFIPATPLRIPSGDSVSIPEKIILTAVYDSIELYLRNIKAFHWNDIDFESIWLNQDSLGVAVFRGDLMKTDTIGRKRYQPAFYFRKNDECKVIPSSLREHFKPFATISIAGSDPASVIAIVRRYNDYLRPKTSH